MRVYVASERAGQRVMESITQYVERRLKLKVSRQKSAVDLAKKRRLLGFRFFGREHEIKVRIDPSARKRAKDRLRQLTSRKWGVSMERRIEEINRYTVGWTNYYALADTPSVFEGLDEWLRRRLRQVRWKEWKRPKTKRRRLIALGIRAREAPSGPTRARATGASQAPQSYPRPAQRLLGQTGPQGIRGSLPPLPGCQANRRMRTRTSGGVGGAGVSPAPTRSTPTTREKSSIQRARVPVLRGAGGEPPREPPAPPEGLASHVGPLTGDQVAAMLERPALSEELVEDAIGRARLRGALELPDGGEIADEVIDELLAGASTEEEIAGPGGLLAQLTKRLIERAMEVELTEHLGYEPHWSRPAGLATRATARRRRR